MQASTVNAINSMLSQGATPVDVAHAVRDATKGELADAGVGAAQVVDGMVNIFGA